MCAARRQLVHSKRGGKHHAIHQRLQLSCMCLATHKRVYVLKRVHHRGLAAVCHPQSVVSRSTVDQH